MRTRLNQHRSASERKAAVAFKIARADAGFTEPDYRRGGKMDLRLVAEEGVDRQYLLEFCLAKLLRTEHNSFATS